MENNSFTLLSTGLKTDVLKTGIQKSNIKDEPQDFLDKEHSSNLIEDSDIDITEHLLKKESNYFNNEDKIRREQLRDGAKILNELDGIGNMRFIKAEINENNILCGEERDIKDESLPMVLDSKIELPDNEDSKVIVKLENIDVQINYDSQVEGSCNNFFSGNLHSGVDEPQTKFPVENVIEDFQSDNRNVNEIFENCKIEILEPNLKEEARDFNTLEEKVESACFEQIEKSNSNKSSCIDFTKNARFVNFKTEDRKIKNYSNNGDFNENSDNSLLVHNQQVIKSFQEKQRSYEIDEQDRSFIQSNFTRKNSPNPKPLFECQDCHKKLFSKQSLDVHIVAKHSTNNTAMATVTRNVYACELCEFKTTKGIYLKSHLQRHKSLVPDKKFECNLCDYKATVKKDLKNHSQCHSVLQEFRCPICDMKLKTEQALDGHIVAKHSKNDEAMATVTRKVYTCEICDFKTIKGIYLKNHFQRHTGVVPDKKFQCNLCDYKTAVRSHLKGHSQCHSVLLPYPCQVCDAKLKSKQSLDGHIVAKHLNNDKAMATVTRKIYTCETCEFKTIKGHCLKIHVQMHEGVTTADKKFQCNLCDYKTFQKCNLKRHIESHRMPHCQMCLKKFKTKLSLDGHIVKKHSDDQKIMNTVTSKVHSCDLCEYKTVETGNLKKHSMTHLKFQCISCAYETYKKSALKRHYYANSHRLVAFFLSNLQCEIWL